MDAKPFTLPRRGISVVEPGTDVWVIRKGIINEVGEEPVVERKMVKAVHITFGFETYDLCTEGKDAVDNVPISATDLTEEAAIKKAYKDSLESWERAVYHYQAGLPIFNEQIAEATKFKAYAEETIAKAENQMIPYLKEKLKDGQTP